ncbi:MAG TPA: tape measure protein [Hymenobacter sp.]|jgi:tape measure domain-containing protein
MDINTAGIATGAREALSISTGLVSGISSTLSGVGKSFLSALSPSLAFTAVQGITSAFSSGLSTIGSSLSSGFSLANSLETTQVAFETLLGSGEAASKMLSDLKSFAASTPFEFPELADAARKLVAFGVDAKDVQGSLRQIGDIAAGVGAPIGALSELFGKAKTAGTLYAEDINQLVGRGIPVIQEFAKQLGVSESEVKKMASEGKITFANLEKAFGDLTKEGGKFGGMMAKQSGTMSGLLSTLSDNFSMTMAGLAAKVIDVFNLKGAVTGLGNFVGSVGAAVQGVIDRWTPAIKAVVAGTVSYLQNAWANLAPYAYAGMAAVSGAVTTAMGWVQSAWQSTTSWLGSNIDWIAGYIADGVVTWYTVVANVAKGVWDLVTTVADGVGTAIGWVWSFFADSAESSGGRVQTTSQQVGSTIKWLADLVQVGFVSASWAIANWRDIAELALTSYALGIVRAGNETEYVFGTVIPAYATWLGSNLGNIFTDIGNLATTTFSNLADNIVKVMSNLPGLLSGAVSFGDLWTPLTDGFKSTLSELPQIAQRQAGALEQSLQGQRDALANNLTNSWANSVTDAQRQSGALAGGIKGLPGSLADLGKPLKPGETPKPGQAPKPAGAPASAAAGAPAGGGAAESDSGGAKSGSTIYTGSAESMALRYAATPAMGAATAEVAKATAGGAPTASNTQSAQDVINTILKAMAEDVKGIRTAAESIDRKTVKQTSGGDVL